MKNISTLTCVLFDLKYAKMKKFLKSAKHYTRNTDFFTDFGTDVEWS